MEEMLVSILHKIRRIIRELKAKEMVPIPEPVNVQKLLEGKVALITGGSGGIGYAIARAFHDSGCKVIIAGTSEAKLQACENKMCGGVSDTL